MIKKRIINDGCHFTCTTIVDIISLIKVAGEHMTILSNIAHGKTVRVIDIDGGHGVSNQLRHLGIIPGDEIIIQRYAPFGGPIMIEVHGRTIALGRRIASKIQVEEKGCVSL